MVESRKSNVDEILRKHGSRIESQMRGEQTKGDYSSEYKKFKDEMAPEFTRFEKWCKSLGNVIHMKVSEKDKKRLQKQIDVAHLDVEPGQIMALGMMSFLVVFLLGILISISIALFKGSILEFPLLLFFLILVISLFLFYMINNYPARLANKWRLKASSQMVPAILYIVVYMRHTPNLEKAVAFAAQHLEYPLSLDLRKVFYDVQVGKFSTIKESLDNYLETWRDYSIEFVEAFHLIESSLFEPSNDRRVAALEKSLQVVLDGVYDRMLKFTHNVRSPLTNVYMLGVVLPTLALALLPLASAMVGEFLQTIHVFLLFNLLIPFLVYYMTDKIMLDRPGGYGETNLLEKNPLYSEYKDNKAYGRAFFICFPLFILGLLPLIFGYTNFPSILGLQPDYTFNELGLSFFGDVSIFGFMETGTGVAGPFGIGALFLSLFIPLSIALFFSISHKSRTKNLVVERSKTKQLEAEFNNSLFQLGNRVGNGIPPELAFGKVAESSKGLKTESFFKIVNYNIRQMGMGVEKAIFDKRRGALVYFPSSLIATSMRVLIESSKKGLKIAANSLMSISEYVKNIQKITNRLKDLLAEIISDMKSNMTFLAPLLSGVVVGLTAMITSILTKLQLADLASSSSNLGSMQNILTLFNVEQMIPPYFLQISIGIYIIQIIFILTGTLVTIDAGSDKLQQTHKVGLNLSKGISLYFITALISTFALFVLSAVVLGNLS